MSKTNLQPKSVGQPVGLYSHAVKVKAGDQIFISGQLALDADGKTVGVGDAGAQTRKVLENIRALLEAGGATMDDIVKIGIYLIDMNDVPKIAAVRKEFFKPEYPASTLVQVSKLIREDCLVEIEAIAVI